MLNAPVNKSWDQSHKRQLLTVAAKQVAGVDLFGHIAQGWRLAVGNDDVAHALEFVQVAYHAGVEEMLVAQVRLVNHDLDALSLDALHDALDAGGSKVVRAGFHDEAVDADDGGRLLRRVTPRNDGLFSTLDHFAGDEIFARAVGADDGLDEGLRHVGVVGQQLFGVFR